MTPNLNVAFILLNTTLIERKKMDEIWGLIDCINDLICKLNDKKKAIMNYECELNGWTFMRIWIEYIWTILDKSNSLDLAVSVSIFYINFKFSNYYFLGIFSD